MPIEKSAGAIIFRKEKGKIYYLVLHYPPDKRISSSRGHWDYVKGHIEKDEVIEDTIRREAKEETGIEDLKFVESDIGELQKIEVTLGKTIKGKEEPRLIDIDILFFGNKDIDIDGLTIPHPRWQERLFVLVPLQEISPTITLPDENTIQLQKLIEQFSSKEPQVINLYNPQDTADENCLHC